MKIFFIIFIFLDSFIFAQDSKQSVTKETLDSNKKYIEENKPKGNIIEDINNNRYDTEKANTYSKKKDHDLRNGNVLLLGGSIGSAGGANINAMYYWKNLVVRGSGGATGANNNGYQFDLGYSFYKGASIIQSVSGVVGGFTSTPFNPTAGNGGQGKYRYDGFPPGYANNPLTLTDTLIQSYITSQDANLGLAMSYLYNQRKYDKIQQNYIGITYDLYMWGFFMQIGAGFGAHYPKQYRDPQILFQLGYMLEL